MRGRPELEEWGRETLAHAEVTYVGSEHIRRVLADVVGEIGVVHEVPPGVDVDLFVLEDRPAALAALLEAARADPPNPGNAEERLPDEGNAERLEEFLAGDAPTVVYFGKLIEQKGVQVLLEAMRDARRAARRRRLRPLPRAARGDGPRAHALHRPARAPPPRAPAPARRPRPSCRRCSPRRSGWSPPRPLPPARRPSSRATRASPRSRRGSRRATRSASAGLASFTSGDSDDLARKLAAIIALSADDHDELRRAARQAVVERWSWHSVAQRLLQPV